MSRAVSNRDRNTGSSVHGNDAGGFLCRETVSTSILWKERICSTNGAVERDSEAEVLEVSETVGAALKNFILLIRLN